MNSRMLLIGFFILMCGVQLYAPVSMIVAKEDVLKTGKPYRFQIEPVDPSDPFRGKYITLRFFADEFRIKNRSGWKEDDEIFVVISNDSAGYAQVDTVLKQVPGAGADYIKAKIAYLAYNDTVSAYIDYPFDRYYMDEFKAPEAERMYLETARDTIHIPYAIICVKEGEAVIQDVIIKDTSLQEGARGKHE